MEILINAVTLGSLYLLFALGMSVAWGTIGILNFAHGSTFMFSAMVAYYTVQMVALPMWAMILLGAAVGMVLSVLTQALIFNFILRRNPDLLKAEMQIVVGGIGAASVLLAIAQHYTKSVPFGFSASTFKTTTYQLGAIHISNVQLVILVAAFGLAGLAAWWLKSARAGLALRAIGVNPEVASLMGVDRGRMALGTMAVGRRAGRTRRASCSPTTWAPSPPESGDSFLIKAFAAIILGGVGIVIGVVVGSLSWRSPRRSWSPTVRDLGRRGGVRAHLPGAALPAPRHLRP